LQGQVALHESGWVLGEQGPRLHSLVAVCAQPGLMVAMCVRLSSSAAPTSRSPSLPGTPPARSAALTADASKPACAAATATDVSPAHDRKSDSSLRCLCCGSEGPQA
jgi:hypothetical protein